MTCVDSEVFPPPQQVGMSVISFCNYLISHFNCIFVCQIIGRCQEPYPGYNCNVDQLNSYFKEQVRNHPSFFFWHHRGFSNNLNTYLGDDDVHLSELRLKKLY